jgi:hypothetical protein
MTEFYISLPSNTHQDLKSSRRNTSSEFHVTLPQAIRLSGDWEVALVEIQHPYSWYTITKEMGKYGQPKNEIRMRNKRTRKVMGIQVRPGNYDNIDHLLAAIHHAVTEKEKYPKAKAFLKGGFQLKYDEIHRLVTIKCLNEELEICFSELMCYMLGFKLPVLTYTATASYPPDLRGGIDSLYVYCDHVQPQIVGDTMEPLLRIIPVGGRFGDVIHRVFVAPHYVGLLNKEFSSVQISIKTDGNRPVPFTFGKSVVKLHFRRKRLI